MRFLHKKQGDCFVLKVHFIKFAETNRPKSNPLMLLGKMFTLDEKVHNLNIDNTILPHRLGW